MIQAALVFFQNMSADDIKSAPTTYRYTYVQQGDVIYLPAGTLMCEKAVGGHSLVLRSYSTLISQKNADGCMFLAGACGPNGQRCLDL